VNVAVPVGVAVRVTTVPIGKSAAQVPLEVPAVLVQVMPVGFETTLPLPVPLLVKARRCDRGPSVRTVCTTLPVAPVTMHGTAAPVVFPVTVQAPLHPTTVAALAGDALSEMVLSARKVPVQVPVLAPSARIQVMPVGVLTIDASPVPAHAAVTWKVRTTNVTLTDCAADIVTVQTFDASPEHGPDHVPMRYPGAGVAVMTTTVLTFNGTLQMPVTVLPLLRQSIPPTDVVNWPGLPAATVAVKANVTGCGTVGGLRSPQLRSTSSCRDATIERDTQRAKDRRELVTRAYSAKMERCDLRNIQRHSHRHTRLTESLALRMHNHGFSCIGSNQSPTMTPSVLSRTQMTGMDRPATQAPSALNAISSAPSRTAIALRLRTSAPATVFRPTAMHSIRDTTAETRAQAA